MTRGRVFAPCSSPVPHAAHFKNGFHCAGVDAGSRSLDAGCIPLAGSGAGGGPAAAPGNVSDAVSHQAASGAGVLLHAPPATSSDGDFVLPCSCWASENGSRCLIDADPSRFKVSS